MYRLLILILALCAFSVPAQQGTPSPADAELYFISPADGATVSNPVTVRFGLKNMGVAPAGIQYDNSGHHHLLVDTELPAWSFRSSMMKTTCTLAAARRKPPWNCPRANTPCNFCWVISPIFPTTLP